MTTSVTAGTGRVLPEAEDPARCGERHSRPLLDGAGHLLITPDLSLVKIGSSV